MNNEQIKDGNAAHVQLPPTTCNPSFHFSEQYLGYGNSGPVEVRVQFYVDYPYWIELEKSPAWHQVADMAKEHQTLQIHSPLPTPEVKWGLEGNSGQSVTDVRHWGKRFSRFQPIWEGICNLLHRQRKG